MTTDFAAPTDVVLAVEIGDREFSAGLMTFRGKLIDRTRAPIEAHVGPQSHFSSVATALSAQLKRAEQHGVVPRVIGVSSGGPVTANCETVSPASVDSWSKFPLREHLVELTGLPVFGELDARALAMSEGWLGGAAGVSSFCTISVGRSVGGGLVIDGELLSGATGRAGEVGHVIVEPGGRRCPCGARGCLDAEASGASIESMTGRALNEPTYDIMTRTGRLVGRAAGMLCSALDIDLVVVGGDVALGFAATFFNAAQREIDDVSRVGIGASPRVTPARLGDIGGLIGAGAVGLRGYRRHRLGADETKG